MKRLVCALLAAVLMGAGCPAAAEEAPRYNYNDTRTLTVRLPQGERTGLIHLVTGRWLIPPIFEAMKLEASNTEELEKNGSLVAVKVDGKWGFADKEGRVVIAAQYQDAYNFTDALYRVVLGGKLGVIDQTGKMITEPRFEAIGRMRDGMSVVEENGKFGFVDAGGRVVIEPQYDWSQAFNEGLALVEVDRKRGFIDKLGNMVIAPQFDRQSNRPFSEGLAAVSLNGKWGFIDRTGHLVIEAQYKSVMSFWGGMAAVRRMDDLMGFIDKTGRMVVEPQFVSAGYPETKGEPYLVIWRFDTKDGTGEYGYLDSSGRLLDTPRFEHGHEFVEGMACVRLGGKEGFINTKGEMVIEPRFTRAGGWFEKGVVRVEEGGKKGFIDKSGRWVASEVSFFSLRLNIGRTERFYCDAEGRILDHYANHMKDGYHYLRVGQYPEAKNAFRAALRLNPDDEAALYGLSLAGNW